jgi:hypothetical protein
MGRIRAAQRKLLPLEGEPLGFEKGQLVPAFRVTKGRGS